MPGKRIGGVPSRTVLEFAEKYNAGRGHELRGFLSAASGFMPRFRTVRSFPASHSAWDEVITRMPELWRTVTLRQALRDMPVLGAGPADLPDEFVWRASVALSVFAHAFIKVEAPAEVGLPPSVAVPWEQISGRLGRREPHMSYNDLIVYNHTLLDPQAPNPYRVDNMELLVPSVDNLEERRFYLAQVEILARSTPIVAAVVRAQEAVARDDRDGLSAELTLMLRTWHDIIELSFRKVDPNPLSATYIDQVVWAKTVAPLAVPIRSGTAGPGGEASPIFHLMDAFLGRKHKASRLGKEVAELREWFPPHHIAFIEAVEQVSVRDYVAASGDRRLRNLFATLFETYAGKKGYLGTHRMKVYGFLELAFKVGREKTITGIVGGFKDQHWKTLDAILEETRLERYRELPPYVQHARIRSREPASPAGTATHVVLDTSETGAFYRPGDRCGVLPTNRPETVEATLRALGATGEERVPLTAEWREAIRYRARHPLSTDALPLRTFLTYAKLRPINGDLARALADATGLRLGHQWELSDALHVLSAEGYPVSDLLTANINDRRALARIVPPESFRMYSISSAPSGHSGAEDELRLTVAQLSHPADADGPRPPDTELLGTASTYLTSTAATDEPVPLTLVRPSRFGLPREASRPVVMFAAGVGVSPFLGFLEQRRADPSSGENWLFLGARTRRHLHGEPEIVSAVATGDLALYVAFSGEDAAMRAGFGETVQTVPATSARLHEAISDDINVQRKLWDLLRNEQNGAHFYVCGRAEFATSIMSVLRQVATRFAAPGEHPEMILRQLVAEGRYAQDVFTAWTPPPRDDPVYDLSEVSTRTTPETGQWLILNEAVYDMTEFLHLHPGGPRIITENLGQDATTEYEAVRHHENSEINAMLAMYRIGAVRRLDLGDHRGTVELPDLGSAEVSLEELHSCWVRLLHLITAMRNALANDWSFMDKAMTRGDDPHEINALKLQHASQTHQRFLHAYYTTILDELPNLAAMTQALTAPTPPARDLGAALTELKSSAEAAAANRFGEHFQILYRSTAHPASLRELCTTVQHRDQEFLASLASVVRDGVIVFEQLQARTATEGGDRLLTNLAKVPTLIRAYLNATATETPKIASACHHPAATDVRPDLLGLSQSRERSY